LIGDVGGGLREEIDWIGVEAARGANFGWSCHEGKIENPASTECPVTGAVEPLFDYADDPSAGDAVTGGFVVRDPSLTGLEGRYLYADYFDGDVRSLALDFSDPDDKGTGLNVPALASFGQDAAGRLYAASNDGGFRRGGGHARGRGRALDGRRRGGASWRGAGGGGGGQHRRR
jgi:hypothetical protein